MNLPAAQSVGIEPLYGSIHRQHRSRPPNIAPEEQLSPWSPAPVNQF